MHWDLNVPFKFNQNSGKTVKNISEQIRNSNSKLVLLFDTKTCKQLNAAHLPREKRLAVISYSERTHVGLGISCIENGTAETLSDTLLDITTEFNLSERIIGLVCDTENTNTGYSGGTCTKFEKKIKKELLHLSCRHHIMEIVLKKVCEKLLGSNQTPHFSFEGSNEIKTQWKNIDKTNFLGIDEEDLGCSPIVSALRNEAIEQIEHDATNPDVRDDYAELDDVCLKLLNIRTNESIRVIGALSKARWIAKALLIAKTYLFRESLDLCPEIVSSLRRLSIFICCLYVIFWNRIPNVFDAPFNDLTFMQQLHLYKEHDDEIAQTAINSFGEHLWYLSEELITLSLFSSKVTVATKNKMRHRFRTNMTSRNEASLKFKMESSTPFNNLNLEDFVQPRSYLLFKVLEIDPDFLHQDAMIWDYCESYKTIKHMVDQTITVINDGSERILGIADNIINTQKARKEKFFKNLTFSKFDKNHRNGSLN